MRKCDCLADEIEFETAGFELIPMAGGVRVAKPLPGLNLRISAGRRDA